MSSNAANDSFTLSFSFNLGQLFSSSSTSSYLGSSVQAQTVPGPSRSATSSVQTMIISSTVLTSSTSTPQVTRPYQDEMSHTKITHIGAIIGGVAAGLILLAGVLIVIWRLHQKRKLRNGSSLAIASVFQDIAVHDGDDLRLMPHNGNSLLAWRSTHARDISYNDSTVVTPRDDNVDATAEQSVDEKTRTENMSREESDTARHTPETEVLPIPTFAGQAEPVIEVPRRQIRMLDSGFRFIYESSGPAMGSDMPELPPEYTED